MVKRRSKWNDWITRAIGSRAEFEATTRLFHAVILFTCILLSVMLPFNLLLGQYYIAWLVGGLLLAHSLLYFTSRIKREYRLAVAGAAVLAYAGASVNYYLNDGINGPTLLIFIFTFLLLTAVTKRRYHGFAFILSCLVVGVLLYVDLHNPGWVKDTFRKPADRVINVYVVFVFILLFIYAITRGLIESYYYEKKRADQRTDDLKAEHAKLEALTLEKEKLFSIVFHDLKSPLASIQMYLEMIEGTAVDKQFEDHIKSELLRLTRETTGMLNNVLLWARSQLKPIGHDRRPVRIAELLDSCVLTEKPFAESKHIGLTASIREQALVLADDNLVKMLVRILLNNAIKFSPRGGEVFISAFREGSRCVVKIKDSGTGISPENEAKIFTLGVQSDPGTNNEKGTGLGLALAYQFAVRQDIELWFNANPGKGAEFFFAVPLVPQQPDQAS